MAWTLNSLLLILLCAAIFLSPIALVWWEVYSLRRRKRDFRFGLQAMFLLTSWIAVLCGLATYTGWVLDTFVIGGAITAGLCGTMLLAWFMFRDIFPKFRFSEADDEPPDPPVVIAPPDETESRSQRRPRSKRTPMRHRHNNRSRME